MEELQSPDSAHLPTIELSAEEAIGIQTRFLTQVYSWMGAALAITGAVAMVTTASPALLAMVFGSRFGFMGLMLVQLGVVVWLSRSVLTMAPGTAVAAFLGYSALSGVTFSALFLAYTMESIASTFFITAGTFGVMSLYGITTRRDLSSWGNLLMMGLVGVLLASVVNWFFHSSVLYWVTTIIGVLLFVALTAYDTQKVKSLAFLSVATAEDEDAVHTTDRRAAVLGALILYLDFVNLFLFLLRIFGRRR